MRAQAHAMTECGHLITDRHGDEVADVVKS